jgi:hypothetical protein
LAKFGRNYRLSIWDKVSPVQGQPLINVAPPSLVIEPPFTLEFDIARTTLASCNTAKLRIYNLGQHNRNFIRFNFSNTGQFQQVQLNAGYGNNLPLVFTGNISQAFSVREGVNFITEIECYDGGFGAVTGTFEGYFPAGTLWATVIATIAAAIPGVSLGKVGSFPGTLARAQCYSGNPKDILNEITGGGVFIDNGKVNVLGSAECIATPNPTVINSQTGLLNTPQVEQITVRFEMLFEPTLHVGEIVIIDSATEPAFNGPAKITGVKHRGTISGAVCGDAVTMGEFFSNGTLTGVT